MTKKMRLAVFMDAWELIPVSTNNPIDLLLKYS